MLTQLPHRTAQCCSGGLMHATSQALNKAGRGEGVIAHRQEPCFFTETHTCSQRHTACSVTHTHTFPDPRQQRPPVKDCLALWAASLAKKGEGLCYSNQPLAPEIGKRRIKNGCAYNANLRFSFALLCYSYIPTLHLSLSIFSLLHTLSVKSEH